MDLSNLLDSMRERGVCLAVHGDQLRYKAPPGFVDLAGCNDRLQEAKEQATLGKETLSTNQ